MPPRHRVAIVCSHPIQYLSPWFAQLSQEPRLDVTVLYGSLLGQRQAAQDRDFGQVVRWDIDLLAGHRFFELQSHSPAPGLDRFAGVASLQVFQLLRRAQFDAVMILGWNYALYPLALLAARAAGLPVILRGDSVRYLDAEAVESKARGLAQLRLRVKTGLLRRYVGACAAALAVSTGNRRLLRHYGVPESRIFAAPYAVDAQRFRLPGPLVQLARQRLRRELGITDDRPLVLFCGKLSPVKAPGLLVGAYARLRRQGTEAALLLCGDGALRSELQSQVARDAIPEVHFLGFRNQSELPELYAAADVLVVPSQREAFALVVAEAMHAGLPVIASDRVGAVEDLVLPEQTGLTFPAGNESALTDCLTRLCHKDGGAGLRHRLGVAAAERMQTWTYVETTRGLLAALDAVHPGGREGEVIESC